MNSIQPSTTPVFYNVPRQAPRLGEAAPLNLPLDTGRLHTLIVNGDKRQFGGNENRSLTIQELASFGNQLGQIYNYYSQVFYNTAEIQNNAQVKQAWSQALNNMYTDLEHVNVLGNHWNTLVGKQEFGVNDLISLANRDNQWWNVSQFDIYGQQSQQPQSVWR
ncbi:MAG: hypothetical protein ACKO34_03900 [Vampirovibrionales bacterium]